MNIKHTKNIYWLIFAMSVIGTCVLHEISFIFWLGIITSTSAFCSIIIGQPIILWAFRVYCFIYLLPFMIPYLLIGAITKSNKEGTFGLFLLVGIAEAIVIIYWFSWLMILFFSISVIAAGCLSWAIFFDDKSNSK